MRLEDFLELFDNWNMMVTINDSNLDEIVSDICYKIYDSHKELLNYTVRAFGFYDKELCISINYSLKEKN